MKAKAKTVVERAKTVVVYQPIVMSAAAFQGGMVSPGQISIEDCGAPKLLDDGVLAVPNLNGGYCAAFARGHWTHFLVKEKTS